MKKVILLSVLILLICLAYSFAEVPCKINYQGRLIKDNVPVDGTNTMVFSIYAVATGGSPIWTSGNVSVEVHNGLFRYVIGSDGGDLSSIDWTAGQELYLEVVIDGETLTPREELSAYPYAINSHLLEGETKEYFINTSGDAQTKDGALNIMGNVGIGTAGPNYALDVASTIRTNGQLRITGNNPGTSWTDTDLVVGDTSANRHDASISIMSAASAGKLKHSGNTLSLTSWNDADIATFKTNKIIATGNVGIGTTSPGTNKLEVVGGPIKATGGLIIETRTSDPASPATGQTWLRTDIP